jgi:hypothetical protein
MTKQFFFSFSILVVTVGREKRDEKREGKSSW